MSVLVALCLHERRVPFADARFLSWIAGPVYQWSTSWETARESVASDAGIEVTCDNGEQSRARHDWLVCGPRTVSIDRTADPLHQQRSTRRRLTCSPRCQQVRTCTMRPRTSSRPESKTATTGKRGARAKARAARSTCLISAYARSRRSRRRAGSATVMWSAPTGASPVVIATTSAEEKDQHDDQENRHDVTQ